jgi:hypothetical protein
MTAPTFLPPQLSLWCSTYPTLSSHVHFEYLPASSDPSARHLFHRERSRFHLKLSTILELSIQEGELNLTKVKVRLSDLIAVPIHPVSPWYFDDASAIMFVRQYAWVMREIRQVLLSVWTAKHAAYDVRLLSLRAYQTLFSIIPEDIVCRIDRDALNWRISTTPTREDRLIQYLQELARRMESGIRHFPRALWEKGADSFLTAIVKCTIPESDTAYFQQARLEHSFGRCLFNPESKWRVAIDTKLDALPIHEFGDAFMALCGEVACKLTHGSKRKFTAADQIVLMLLIFRLLFNRMYERDPHRFAPRADSAEFVRRAVAIGGDSADSQPLPWRFLPKIVDRSVSMRELFQGDPIYAAASAELSLALFECNPLDQLYRIHKALLGVNKGADVHIGRCGKSSLLGFDDHFAILFGIWMASEIPDACYLKWMIDSYAPKGSLSSPFEYALANLEGVVLHVEQIWEMRGACPELRIGAC